MVAPGEPASASGDGWFCPRPERPWFSLLPQGFFDRTAERVEPPFEVTGNVGPHRPPAALGENVEIAARLRRLDNAKRVGVTGHRQVIGVIAGDLQENPTV